ncbi:unnamed protein product, partial [Mesorhabditis belari]|uniref:Transposase n=1 Tax=Mesorhabditis belari TaxID=2138241 RepID=A0AAF3EX45_9BILA
MFDLSDVPFFVYVPFLALAFFACIAMITRICLSCRLASGSGGTGDSRIWLWLGGRRSHAMPRAAQSSVSVDEHDGQGNGGHVQRRGANGNTPEPPVNKMRVDNHIHKNNIVFHHDNARPHVERHVVESIASKGWDLLPHPPYSPTEAPTDYHVNRSLKNWQTNKIYNDLDDLIDDVKAWIASKDRLFFARGIDRLPSKWQSVIDVGGEYAPE